MTNLLSTYPRNDVKELSSTLPNISITTFPLHEKLKVPLY